MNEDGGRIELRCSRCGRELALEETEFDGQDTTTWSVEPCENCLDQARSEGREEMEP